MRRKVKVQQEKKVRKNKEEVEVETKTPQNGFTFRSGPFSVFVIRGKDGDEERGKQE